MRRPRILLLALAALAALLIAGCGDDDDGGEETQEVTGIEAVAAESCGEVEYGGEGEPRGLIVSDLPLQGDSATRSTQQNEAIRLALEQNDWTAGSIPVAFQACDDTIAETGLWDEQLCRDNAAAYVANPDVLGVIGTYNSGCAAEEIPILNKGGVAMVSPGNTDVCLTLASSTCKEGQPISLYPTGKPNYARVVPNDAFQGAALVEFSQEQGIKSPFVLHTVGDSTSIGQAANYRDAAAAEGLKLAGYETWDPEAASYGDLMRKVKSSGADGVILAGLTEHNGGKLIRDKVSIVGNNELVPLIAYDGFAQQSTIDEAGEEVAAGMYAGAPGRAPQNLTGQGEQFADVLGGRIEGTLELYAPYAGEAALVLMEAIEKAGTDRPAIAAALYDIKREDGILGTYEITPTGDPSSGPVTIFVAGRTFEPETEIVPPSGLVVAARGED